MKTPSLKYQEPIFQKFGLVQDDAASSQKTEEIGVLHESWHKRLYTSNGGQLPY